ncbi:MAG: DUF116 domain-containing protein [Candidatus Latescibacterota bacterium]
MDRKLGDEWESWEGEFISPEEVRAGGRLFLSLLLISVIILVTISLCFLFLISPRLAQLSERLPSLFASAIGMVAALCAVWFAILIVSIKQRSALFPLPAIYHLFYGFSLVANRLGQKFGLSRDKVGHSFIKVSNALTIGRLKLKPNLKVLVLLPRCLSKDAKEQITGICARYDVIVKIAGGGEVARKFVRQYSPDAVIGVACERDLVSGIQDVSRRIPIIGIPNIRPDGPCMATYIEYDILKDTLATIYRDPANDERDAAGHPLRDN